MSEIPPGRRFNGESVAGECVRLHHETTLLKVDIGPNLSRNDFYSGLNRLNYDGASAKRQMLVAHYESPGHEIYVDELAHVVGWDHHGPVNLHYPSIGQAICRGLGLQGPQNVQGREKWWPVLSIGYEVPGGRFLWKMRPEAAGALEELGWVESASSRITEELDPTDLLFREGDVVWVCVPRYERSARARADCVAAKGARCTCCEMTFAGVYGEAHGQLIAVHHLESIAAGPRDTNPVSDLVPVCHNCHAVIHSRRPKAFTIDEVRQMLAETGVTTASSRTSES